ncbi:unnamed protein product [Spirodela intermedia]|uniref:Uncharacterized protein n=1 Tax=Spirodela intermedia TaxID=51605 RepID=A0A7I8L1N7_SPIIN|nr:unnamed protein product [Spirodela intermedia]
MATTARYWFWLAAAVLFRVALIGFSGSLKLDTRPEVATPLTSIRRLAEGYWLKKLGMSPYSGSMYHGSPLLLAILGPLTAKRTEGRSDYLFCGMIFVMADFVTAMLLRSTGRKLQSGYKQFLRSAKHPNLLEASRNVDAGEVASLIFLWNPMGILASVGMSTSAIDNLMVIISLYGACSRLVPLSAFGWAIATHLSLYPVILIIPVILLLGYGPDAPPKKLHLLKNLQVSRFSWRPVMTFILWAFIWSAYVLALSSISLGKFGGLTEMFKKTYGFILTVEDLSPNIGVLWYFFAEVFEIFRGFFLIVFNINILFMLLPLAIRLSHRPCFLAFVYVAISSMLKSYPSVGDSALYLGLLALFINELQELRFSFLIFCGYIGVSFLSPVMHNLWIWRGTGNANFYFATGIAYACLQTLLVVESVNGILNHDRTLRKRLVAG